MIGTKIKVCWSKKGGLQAATTATLPALLCNLTAPPCSSQMDPAAVPVLSSCYLLAFPWKQAAEGWSLSLPPQHWVAAFATGLTDLRQPVPQSSVLGSAAESRSSSHLWPAAMPAVPLHAALRESSQNALEPDELSCSLCLHNTDEAAISRGSEHGSLCLAERHVLMPGSQAGIY